MADPTRAELLVELSSMNQLAEARDQDDDWTGLKDRAARRKRQSRLNARSYRKRKLQRAISSTYEVQIETCRPLQLMPIVEQAYMHCNLQGAYSCLHRLPHTSRSRACKITLSHITPSFRHLSLDGSITLPLSLDHLIPLVQFNVFRATLTNMILLSVVHLIPRQCDISTALQTTPLFPIPATLPPCLMPTSLQQSVPHDMWIDLIPDSTMRDNAIRMMDTFDYNDICNDMVGGIYGGRNTIELTGILVWGNPWETSGWEVTEGFAKKWGFLLRGCSEVKEATNRWRTKRGDEPLIFEI